MFLNVYYCYVKQSEKTKLSLAKLFNFVNTVSDRISGVTAGGGRGGTVPPRTPPRGKISLPTGKNEGL